MTNLEKLFELNKDLDKKLLFEQLKKLNIDIQKHSISGYILTFDNVSIRIRFRKENILIYRGVDNDGENWSCYLLHKGTIDLIKKEMLIL